MEFRESHELQCPKCKTDLNLKFERPEVVYKLEIAEPEPMQARPF